MNYKHITISLYLVRYIYSNTNFSNQLDCNRFRGKIHKTVERAYQIDQSRSEMIDCFAFVLIATNIVSHTLLSTLTSRRRDRTKWTCGTSHEKITSIWCNEKKKNSSKMFQFHSKLKNEEDEEESKRNGTIPLSDQRKKFKKKTKILHNYDSHIFLFGVHFAQSLLV